jgi:anionic cell wall polymer biosynthesis LytR-Cps2A-Psr (LCP) family protein
MAPVVLVQKVMRSNVGRNIDYYVSVGFLSLSRQMPE